MKEIFQYLKSKNFLNNYLKNTFFVGKKGVLNPFKIFYILQKFWP